MWLNTINLSHGVGKLREILRFVEENVAYKSGNTVTEQNKNNIC